MTHRVPLIEKIATRLAALTAQQLVQLKQQVLAGAEPDHGPVILSYIFNKEHDLRPRLRLCRNRNFYGGHDLAPPTPEVMAALKLREEKRQKNPEFSRYLHHQRHLAPSYRRERGLHNKRRRQVYGRGANVKIGYRTPRLCRHYGPLGYPQVLVANQQALSQVPATSVVRLGKVGLRTRFRLEHGARLKRLWVVNGFKWERVCNN